MHELGDAARLWVYLKIMETFFTWLMIPIAFYIAWKVYK